MTFRLSIARRHGYCGGVRRALRLAQQALEDYRNAAGPVVSVGQLIHNESALADVALHGLQSIDRVEDAPPDSVVILRAHGTPQRQRDILAAKNCIAIDTACPALSRAHQVVRQAAADKTTVALFGDAAHEECIALADGHPNVHTGTDAESIAAAIAGTTGPIAVISQSSKPPEEFDAFVEQLRRRTDAPLEIHATICSPVTRRLEELQRLLHTGVDLMIVVGGTRSSNSHGLARVARRHVATRYLQRPQQIDPGWIAGDAHVGLIGGTSTPLSVLQAFAEHLVSLGGVIIDDGGIAEGDSAEKPVPEPKK